MTAPPVSGEIVLRTLYNDGCATGVQILQADPRVLISGGLVRQLHEGDPGAVKFASITKPEVGGVLRINGSTASLSTC